MTSRYGEVHAAMRSGKILRGAMKKIADRETWAMPATIDDHAVLDEIVDAIKAKE